MRRLLVVTMLIAACAAAVIVLPRWTAGKVEAQREAVYWRTTHQTVPSALPFCPAPGSQRETFLEQRASATRNSTALWVPVCRVPSLPANHVIIFGATPTDLDGCRLEGKWKPTNVMCAVEESLTPLADSRAPRTRARRESDEIIWITSQPLSWREHLISEHRQWLGLGLLFVALLAIGARRTGRALARRAACHAPGEPVFPQYAELWLHWMLGEQFPSLPGDLGEEYIWKLENGCSRQEADRWYRWQVFHSIAPLAARCTEFALTGRGRFKRRG